jgi:hypothetical protein
MDTELLVRISTAIDDKPTLVEVDRMLGELATIRRKDADIHRMADALLDRRAELTTPAPLPV